VVANEAKRKTLERTKRFCRKRTFMDTFQEILRKPELRNEGKSPS